MLCILGAVEEELSFFLSKFSFDTISLGKKSIWVNLKKELLLAKTGTGIINAAYTVTLIFEKFPIKAVILTGSGGTFLDTGLKLGDITIADEEIWADASDYLLHRFPLTSSLLTSIKQIVPDCLSKGVAFKIGSFLTVSKTTDDKEKSLFLRKQFPHCICENMEGAAIAQICQIYNVPLLEIRGISNFLGEYNRKKWKIKLANKNVQQLLLTLLKRKKEWL